MSFTLGSAERESQRCVRPSGCTCASPLYSTLSSLYTTQHTLVVVIELIPSTIYTVYNVALVLHRRSLPPSHCATDGSLIARPAPFHPSNPNASLRTLSISSLVSVSLTKRQPSTSDAIPSLSTILLCICHHNHPNFYKKKIIIQFYIYK